MGFWDKVDEWAAKPRFDMAGPDNYFIRGDRLVKGNGVLWNRPIAGAAAEFQSGADRGSRVTLTRVAAVGIFAVGWRKSKNKVYVLVQLADGEQVLIEDKVKAEKKARMFAMQINKAGEHFAKHGNA